MADSQLSLSRALLAESFVSEESKVGSLVSPTVEKYEASQKQSFSEFSESQSQESEEFEVTIKAQLAQPRFSFMASICGTNQEAEYIPLALHDLCLEIYMPAHPTARCISYLTSNMNQTFGAIVAYYPAYEIVEKNQRKWFEIDEDTPQKFSKREVEWARRLMEIFNDLEKTLETLLTDTEKVWKNSSSNESYFSALVNDKRTVKISQEMSHWTKNLKQLNTEVMHKQPGRVQNPPAVSHAQSSNTKKNPVDHPLRRSGNAKSISYESEEDYNW